MRQAQASPQAAADVLAFIDSTDAGADVTSADDLVLRAAVSAYLGRYRGQSRMHSQSDLWMFLR
jgi:hypothetical protein